MTSSVFFKFKSQKEFLRVEFDGTGISVFELKRDIIIKSNLGDGTEFDLAIYSEDGKEEYSDDTTIIPRSTSVIARRLPPLKQGAGRAARYLTGKAPVNAKNTSRKEQSIKGFSARPSAASSNVVMSAATEEERMAAMFAAQTESWSAVQEEMANQTTGRSGAKRTGMQIPVPDHPPPPGYVCYRCAEKGHWIQVCPTNDNAEFDNKPRIKRTTGIPRSFLKTVEKPVALTNDGLTDDSKGPQGVMVNADGDYVIAVPDSAAWERFQTSTMTTKAAVEAAKEGSKELQEKGLQCGLDKRMFDDPMKTPCCGAIYCNECITNALIESDFICPACSKDEIFIDNLIPDPEMAARCKSYLEEKATVKKEITADRRSMSPTASSPSFKPDTASKDITTTSTKSTSPQPQSPTTSAPQTTDNEVDVASTINDQEVANETPKPEASLATDATSLTTTNPLKRAAPEPLVAPTGPKVSRVPRGPKAMQQQQAMMNGMTMGMGGMGVGMGFDMSGMPLMPPMGMMGMPTMGMGMGMAPMGMGNMNMMTGMPNMGMGPMMPGFPVIPMLGATSAGPPKGPKAGVMGNARGGASALNRGVPRRR